MPGETLTMLTIKADGTLSESQVKPNDLTAMQAAVGGYIESVPYWDSFLHNGQPRRCWAICNEEGKIQGLPDNLIATTLWFQNVPSMKGRDILVGDVALIYGDAELMGEL